jgi:septal ring factor EnvC (AmiA/AmiB activator)
MQRHQSEYAAAMAPHGLQRGIPVTETKRRHIGLKESSGSGGQGAKLAAELATAKTELARVTGHFENLKRLSMGDVKTISTLKKQVDKLEKELAEAKATIAKFKAARVDKPELQAPKEVLAAVDLVLVEEARQRLDAEKTALEAFLAEHKGLPTASEGDVAVGTPVASCGRLVVLHIGKGRHVMYAVPEGQAIPKMPETQQQKGGIAR